MPPCCSAVDSCGLGRLHAPQRMSASASPSLVLLRTLMTCVFRRLKALLVLLVLAAFPGRAHAQNWSFDAWKIALGGIGGGNLATKMIDEQRRYTSIVLPFGVFQVLSDTDVF